LNKLSLILLLVLQFVSLAGQASNRCRDLDRQVANAAKAAARQARIEVRISRAAERDLAKLSRGNIGLLERAQEILRSASRGPDGIQDYVKSHPGSGFKKMKGTNNQFEMRLNGGYRAVWKESLDDLGNKILEFLGFNKDITH
jgi:hypothetical protein